jgi:hypothetical protein
LIYKQWRGGLEIGKYRLGSKQQRWLIGRVLGALTNDVVLGFFRARPDVEMLPIVPNGHRGTCGLLPQRFAMRQRPVRCQLVDGFPSFHCIDEHLRIMTGIHAATVPGPIAVHAYIFGVCFLENGVLIRQAGPVFGGRGGAKDERD